MLHDAFEHGRYDEAVGHAVRLHGVQPCPGVELREDHHLTSAPHRRKHRGGTGDVVEGNRDEEHIDVFGGGVRRFDSVRHVD